MAATAMIITTLHRFHSVLILVELTSGSVDFGGEVLEELHDFLFRGWF